MIDQGGVGDAVIELYRGKAAFARARIVGIKFTSGEAPTEDDAEDLYKVPKKELADNMLVLLQLDRVKIAKGQPTCAKLAEELKQFGVKYTTAGGMKFEAAEGEHDDLVTSLAQGLWIGEHVWEPEIG